MSDVFFFLNSITNFTVAQPTTPPTVNRNEHSYSTAGGNIVIEFIGLNCGF